MQKLGALVAVVLLTACIDRVSADTADPPEQTTDVLTMLIGSIHSGYRLISLTANGDLRLIVATVQSDGKREWRQVVTKVEPEIVTAITQRLIRAGLPKWKNRYSNDEIADGKEVYLLVNTPDLTKAVIMRNQYPAGYAAFERFVMKNLLMAQTDALQKAQKSSDEDREQAYRDIRRRVAAAIEEDAAD